MIIERLHERHLPLVDAFSCTETSEMLADLKADERRRVRKHSKEMEDFFHEEAFSEQELGMSTTYLVLDDGASQILAYISLCNDAINLEFQERTDSGITYGSAPALKIARLAVSVDFVRQGLGKQLIQFAAFQAQRIRQYSGVFFLTLDCYEHRVSFYESLGFVRNLIQPVALRYDSPISMRLGLDAFMESLAVD